MLPVEQLVGLDVSAIEEALIVEAPLCVDEEGNLLPTDILWNTVRVLDVLGKLGKAVKAQLTQEIRRRGEQKIEGALRSWFVVKEGKGSDEISVTKAGPLLRNMFTLEECDCFLKIAKGELLKMVKARVPKGEKKGAADALMESLREAGAIEEGTLTYTLAVIQKEVER